jgi:hypothetical protein
MVRSVPADADVTSEGAGCGVSRVRRWQGRRGFPRRWPRRDWNVATLPSHRHDLARTRTASAGARNGRSTAVRGSGRQRRPHRRLDEPTVHGRAGSEQQRRRMLPMCGPADSRRAPAVGPPFVHATARAGRRSTAAAGRSHQPHRQAVPARPQQHRQRERRAHAVVSAERNAPLDRHGRVEAPRRGPLASFLDQPSAGRRRLRYGAESS